MCGVFKYFIINTLILSIYCSAQAKEQFHLDPVLKKKNNIEYVGLNIKNVWKKNVTGKGIVIAMLSDGFDLTHEALPEDVIQKGGYDFADDDFDVNPSTFTKDPEDYEDEGQNDIQGTALSGLIVGRGNIRGIAFNAKILPIRVYRNNVLISPEELAKAILYAAKRAHIIVIPLSIKENEIVTKAIKKAVSLKKIINHKFVDGTLIFNSAGNEYLRHGVVYPAKLSTKYPNLFSVGACDPNGRRSSYSNFNKDKDEISCICPNNDVWDEEHYMITSDISGEKGHSKTNYTKEIYGTGVAATLASGVAALVWSKKLELTAQEVAKVLRSTAWKAPWYRTSAYGVGLLDADRACQKVK